MPKYAGMKIFLFYFVQHGIDGGIVDLIDKYGIRMVQVFVNGCVQLIAQKNRLVAKIDFNKHGKIYSEKKNPD